MQIRAHAFNMDLSLTTCVASFYFSRSNKLLPFGVSQNENKNKDAECCHVHDDMSKNPIYVVQGARDVHAEDPS